MATTLEQFWTDEVARLLSLRTALDAETTGRRGALQAAQATQLLASDSLRLHTAAVDAARQALAAIAMPADGDPLLVAMELARVAQADAQAALASADFAVQVAQAELKRMLATQATLDATLAEAQATLRGELVARAARQLMIERLTSGALSTLAADAALALSEFESDARARVEAEFPGSATNAKNFLKRARARRALVDDSLQAASAVEAAAEAAAVSPLAQAQRQFDSAVAALRDAADAAPRLDADGGTLARLAALPAPTASSRPIVSRWQFERLHDPSRKTARENALTKLTDVDAAMGTARAAQQAYDNALHAAIRAEPDKTRAELDATTLSAELATLTSKLGELQTARAALSADEVATVKAWFAAVPDRLWDELDKLDGALARLAALVGPPTPAERIDALVAAETALTAALAADRLARRGQAAAGVARQRAAAMLAAERETAWSRGRAFAHSGALF